MKRLLLITILLIFKTWYCAGQIKTESRQTPEFYVKNVLLGKGIYVSNIRFIGGNGALGQFAADPFIIGVKSGIILSTGCVDSISGPNLSNSYTSFSAKPSSKETLRLLRRGDRDLNKITKRGARDIAVLEFDFIPIKNKIEYNYVFASEEYPEYSGSQYNDAFAFFLSGPEIKKKVNLAVLNDGITPVSINTVNHFKNSEFYRNNSASWTGRKVRQFQIWYVERFFSNQEKINKFNKRLYNQLQFDGLTTVLKVEYDVIPFSKYHIKIAIADASDQIFDSAVLLEAGSFISVEDSNGKYFDTLQKIESRGIDYEAIIRGQINDSSVIEDSTIDNISYEVYFNLNSAELSDSAKQVIKECILMLKENNKLKCLLNGNTDNLGKRANNQILSEDRTFAVENYLLEYKIEAEKIQRAAYNSERPKYDNNTEAGHQRNRRVEIILYME
ncbi:MAG: choice-of-anchor L domain-containing protein [Flavobacterium sp.]